MLVISKNPKLIKLYRENEAGYITIKNITCKQYNALLTLALFEAFIDKYNIT